MLLPVKRVVSLFGISRPALLWRIRNNRVRATVINGRYEVDVQTLVNPKKGKYANQTIRRVNREWMACEGIITRLGPEAAVGIYSTLVPEDRLKVDEWCQTRGIASPGTCQPAP